METRYEIINPEYNNSCERFFLTFDEVVEYVIDMNECWQTDFTEDDFDLTGNGILCRGILIAEEYSEEEE